MIAAREPGLRVSAGIGVLYSGVPYSCTVPPITLSTIAIKATHGFGDAGNLPTPKSFRILGGPSKAENKMVTRPKLSRM